MTVEKVEEVTKQLISNFYKPAAAIKDELGSDDKKERTKDDKRHLFLLMFRLYQILPFEKLLKNFGKEFNEVCVKERPAILSRYSLTQFCIAELKQGTQQFCIPLKYNFTNGTTKELHYHNSEIFRATLHRLCMFVKNKDVKENHDDVKFIDGLAE